MPNVSLGHLKITPGDTDQVIAMIGKWIRSRSNAYCIPINLTKYVVSQKDEKLAESINQADLVIADGVPIKWLGKRAGHDGIHRVTGVDLSERLLAMAKKQDWSLYFLGASPENLARAIERVNSRFGEPNIVGMRDGYFSDDEIPAIVQHINECKPDILFLGLGMPQKEYFLHDQHANLDVPFCITVGGAIDIWADTKKRTPKIIQSLGLEWFVRSMYDVSKATNILKYGGVFLKELVFYKKHASADC